MLVGSLVVLLQICDKGGIATATPITEEGLALLLLHILQVLDYLQAGVLYHLVLFCLWISAELWHHQHVRSQGQHLLRHLVRDFTSGLPRLPCLVYLVARQIDLCLPRTTRFSLLFKVVHLSLHPQCIYTSPVWETGTGVVKTNSVKQNYPGPNEP